MHRFCCQEETALDLLAVLALRHPGTLEIHLERGIEAELKGLILYLTHWALTSGASSLRSDPHKY
jgi:hypothetical protein